MTGTQQSRARLFHELHHRDQILVLLNAWDAASARIFELAGAPAIATTSSGLAASMGYPDGEKISRELMLTVTRQICRVVDIPVSVDLESGYGATVGDVCETVRGVIDAGGVGINIEDGTRDADVLVAKITAIRALAAARDVRLFVNARADVYLFGKGDPSQHFDDTVRRLRAYEAAGADGLFVPGVRDAATIARLLREIHLPLNILAGDGVPPAKELERIGVRRVSVGGGPMRAALTTTRRVANDLLNEGTYSGFLGETISHAECTRMFTRA